MGPLDFSKEEATADFGKRRCGEVKRVEERLWEKPSLLFQGVGYNGKKRHRVN